MFLSKVKINDKEVSSSKPVYFIAEIGSNFDGDLDKAKQLIRLAKDAGADAAKFQHYTASGLVSDKAFKALDSQLGHQAEWSGSVSEVYDNASLKATWTSLLKKECDKVGIDFLTSPYSLEFIDFVDEYVPAFKIGSGDITWISAVEEVAKRGKPVILATGASSIDDVERAVEAIGKYNKELVLMQCNTNYTAQDSNYNHLNLNVLNQFKSRFPGVVLGLSDHMPGYSETIAAVALGARVIEKHFTDNRDNDGPDHKFALDPVLFEKMVNDVRSIEKALGDGIKRVERNEIDTKVVQRRSLHASRSIEPGELLTAENTVMLRPAPDGCIEPFDFDNIEGSPVNRLITEGETIFHEDLICDK